MPIIEFRCRSCMKTFEQLIMKADAGHEVICPYCGGQDNERLFSVFGFVRRGAVDHSSAGGTSSGCATCSRSSCAGCGE